MIMKLIRIDPNHDGASTELENSIVVLNNVLK